eukprot:TRINITY_DN5366_c0_g1_i1.p2 TRINITY_DN5366_c0_g1~~TRINITY_DN5366_c0_g1_i1.p2  ORF type:complete len:160 (+),score=39.22 TRINITY_DN5366_c0_g1_i1:142-621(+)
MNIKLFAIIGVILLFLSASFVVAQEDAEDQVDYSALSDAEFLDTLDADFLELAEDFSDSSVGVRPLCKGCRKVMKKVAEKLKGKDEAQMEEYFAKHLVEKCKKVIPVMGDAICNKFKNFAVKALKHTLISHLHNGTFTGICAKLHLCGKPKLTPLSLKK